MVHRTIFGFSVLLVMGLVAIPARATVIDISIPPDPGFTVGDAVLTGSSNAAPGYAPGSWAVETPTTGHVFLWLFFDDLAFATLPEGTRIADIASITYHTNKPGGQNDVDWFYGIYTYAEGDGQDAAGWYRSRLTSLPWTAANRNAPANEWTLWSTEPGDNQSLFHETRSNEGGGPTLADLVAGTIDWENDHPSLYNGVSSWDYSQEEIRGIALQVGDSGAGTFPYEGLLGSFRVELTDGTVYNFNFIPEPATLGLLGLGGLAMLRRRRRAAA